MILVDTSIWIDHLHRPNKLLVEALSRSRVVQHPMVVGELAMGTLRDRVAFLELLTSLSPVRVASHVEVLHAVEEHGLHGRGLGLVDAHLLTSLLLTPGARLWTRDRRLRAAAEELDLAGRG